MIFLLTIDSYAKHRHLALLGFTLRVGRVIVFKLKNFSTSFSHRSRLFSHSMASRSERRYFSFLSYDKVNHKFDNNQPDYRQTGLFSSVVTENYLRFGAI